MREALLSRCKLFIENRNLIKEKFSWESTYMYPLCAGIFTSRNQTVNQVRMAECNAILKEKTGIFSNFRCMSKLPVVTMMALAENPVEKLEKSLRVYELLKGEFWGSNYLPMVSMIIEGLTEEENYEGIVRKTRHIYNLMKEEHPFLTSAEDSPMAALLALSSQEAEDAVKDMENCYQNLKEEFFSGNAVQSLSHVLAMGEGSAEMKCRRTMELFRALKERGKKYGTSYELATLGVLALVDVSVDVLAREIAEVDDYLSTQKGFGVFGVGSRQRLMYAGMLVMGDYVKEACGTMEVSAVSGVISVIIAEQAAMCAAVAATTAAASSAN